jgi:hypothetical protein
MEDDEMEFAALGRGGDVPHDAGPAKVVAARGGNGVEQQGAAQGAIELVLFSHPIFVLLVLFINMVRGLLLLLLLLLLVVGIVLHNKLPPRPLLSALPAAHRGLSILASACRRCSPSSSSSSSIICQIVLPLRQLHLALAHPSPMLLLLLPLSLSLCFVCCLCVSLQAKLELICRSVVLVTSRDFS